MFCPECGIEYREGFTHCSDCDVDLVWQQPEPGQPDVHLVKVFESGTPALIAAVESMFDDAGIEFLARSANLQELFGGGRLGTGFNAVVGPVEYWVREDQESVARDLVRDLTEANGDPLAEDEPVPGEEPD